MKSLIVFLFAFVFAFVGQSCCNSGVLNTNIFVINSLDSGIFLFTHNDQGNRYDSIEQLGIVHLDTSAHFMIGVTFDDSVVSIVEAPIPNRLGQSAYACGESYDVGTIQSDIALLSIITNHDFDSTHLTGANMDGMFTISEQGLLNNTALSMQAMALYFNKHLNNWRYYPQGTFTTNFYLIEPPTLSDTISFSVSFLFQDGSTVQTQTKDVIIK